MTEQAKPLTFEEWRATRASSKAGVSQFLEAAGYLEMTSKRAQREEVGR